MLIHWPIIIEIIFTIYAIWAVGFIIMDEREPATAMAWIFFVILAPAIGIFFYIFFGRNLRIVRRRDSQDRRRANNYIEQQLKPWLSGQKATVGAVIKSLPTPAHARLLKLNTSSASTLLTTHNSVEILQNGATKFPRLKADLASAQVSINMAYFIWGDDELTRQIADILIDRSKHGVTVRVLYDALGSVGYMNRKYKQLLRRGGVKIYGSRSLNSLANIAAFNNRNHTKVVTIDNTVGYNGGMNMAEEYLTGGKKYDSWRDTQIRVSGEAVVGLQAVFALNWFVTTGEELDSSYFKPVVTDSKQHVPIQLVYSSPYTPLASIKMMYAEMLTSAQRSVCIQSPYFIPDASLIDAIRNASLAGIDVKVMITGIPDKKSVLAAGQSYFHSIIAAGAKVYLYKAGFLHTKAISIDSEICTIGSANFDTRSFNLNFEATNLIIDPKTARQFESDFAADIKKSQEFTLQTWTKLPLATRLWFSICRLASPLL